MTIDEVREQLKVALENLQRIAESNPSKDVEIAARNRVRELTFKLERLEATV